jgi:methylmalonyl-CoA/ethylmalonyl-CoA epimerase
MADRAPTKVAQVAISVRDVERAKAWYSDVLGLAHLFDAPPGLSFFQCGETRLMLSEPEGPDTAGNSILYYGVPDVAAAH